MNIFILVAIFFFNIYNHIINFPLNPNQNEAAKLIDEGRPLLK